MGTNHHLNTLPYQKCCFKGSSDEALVRYSLQILANPNMDNATQYIGGNLNIYAKLRGFTQRMCRGFIKDTPKVIKSQKLRCFYKGEVDRGRLKLSWRNRDNNSWMGETR